jgi:hypothetical protein
MESMAEVGGDVLLMGADAASLGILPTGDAAVAKRMLSLARASEATGSAGTMPRAGRVVIGENMTRVREYAQRVGAETFTGTGMEANREWIRTATASGKEVVDIGPDFGRRLERMLQGKRPGSPFYNMERMETRGGSISVFERIGKYEGGVPGLDF